MDGSRPLTDLNVIYHRQPVAALSRRALPDATTVHLPPPTPARPPAGEGDETRAVTPDQPTAHPRTPGRPARSGSEAVPRPPSRPGSRPVGSGTPGAPPMPPSNSD